MHAFSRYNKGKVQIFDLIARGNATETANGCQMMSSFHVKKV